MDEHTQDPPEDDDALYRKVDTILGAPDDDDEESSELEAGSGATALRREGQEDEALPPLITPQDRRRQQDNAYFAEDEELSVSDDEVVFKEQASAAFQQMDGVVAVSLEGLYDEVTGEVFSARHLKRNPPALVLASGDGQEGEFLVTKEMAATLTKYFSDLNRAYNGVNPNAGNPLDVEGFRGKAYGGLNWLKTHPLVILLVVVVLAVLVANALH